MSPSNTIAAILSEDAKARILEALEAWENPDSLARHRFEVYWTATEEKRQAEEREADASQRLTAQDLSMRINAVG
jgi:hypothetical protein